MSKVKKVASAPSVAAKAAKETTSSVVSIGMMVLIAIFVVIPLLPSIGEQAVKATGQAAVDAAGRLPSYPLPANGNRTVPPTTAAPKPYGEPNGPVRLLPSQLPPATIPPARGGLPTLGQAPSGGLLGKVPEIGPGLEAGARAIAPGLKALGKG